MAEVIERETGDIVEIPFTGFSGEDFIVRIYNHDGHDHLELLNINGEIIGYCHIGDIAHFGYVIRWRNGEPQRGAKGHNTPLRRI